MLIGNLPGMAYRCRNDERRTLAYASAGCLALTGYTPQELVGSANPCLAQLIHADDRQRVWDEIQLALAAREQFTLIYRTHDRAGQHRLMWDQGVGVWSALGELVAIEGFISDVTERQLLDRERHKAQKLEAVGTLAGGIAHDFNNLLQGVFGYISLARRHFDDPRMAVEMLDNAEQALRQAVSLTNQLLTFAKGGVPVKRPLSLRPVLEAATTLALSGLATLYRLKVEGGLCRVDADEGQVTQVVQNIVRNAAQAMAGGGVVVVAARNVPAPDAGWTLHGETAPWVEITITDTGCGIAPENLARIFDPYFTTKAGGTGLGLATSFSIIKQHGGILDVRSQLGRGSTFTILLPASKGTPEVLAPTLPAPQATRRGRVLLMDDEDIVRAVTLEMLRTLGHEVEAVANGERAVSAFREAKAAGRPFDVVLLDLTVRGGMGGRDTLPHLRAIDPDVVAVVSSGYSDDAILADYRKNGFAAALTKPYTLATMRDVIDALLRA